MTEPSRTQVAGFFAALAAGGFHVMDYAAGWVLLSMAAGFGAGAVFMILGKRKPAACVLLGIEVALAMVQAVFIVQNL